MPACLGIVSFVVGDPVQGDICIFGYRVVVDRLDLAAGSQLSSFSSNASLTVQESMHWRDGVIVGGITQPVRQLVESLLSELSPRAVAR